MIQDNQRITKDTILSELQCQVSRLLSYKDDWKEACSSLQAKLKQLEEEIQNHGKKAKQAVAVKHIGQHYQQQGNGALLLRSSNNSSTIIASATLPDYLQKSAEPGIIDLTDDATLSFSDISNTCHPLNMKEDNNTAGSRVNSEKVYTHPAPPPAAPDSQWAPPDAKVIPPKPSLKCSLTDNGISLNWTASVEVCHEAIAFFQLYSYQQTMSAPSSGLWKKIGNVKALPLPMACTLSQFQPGNKYYFAVRAMDIHQRVGPFSEPSTITLDEK